MLLPRFLADRHGNVDRAALAKGACPAQGDGQRDARAPTWRLCSVFWRLLQLSSRPLTTDTLMHQHLPNSLGIVAKGTRSAFMRVLSRIALVITAYFCGVMGLFVAFTILFGLASFASFAPAYWTLTGVSPAIVAGAPVVGLFLVTMAVVLSAVPILLMVMFAELFAWRSLSVYAIPAALLSAGIYWELSPRTIGGLDLVGSIEIAIFAMSGAFAGSIYWAIAGRRAGSWR